MTVTIPTDVFHTSFSRISEKLWQGGYPLRGAELAAAGFDVIVLSAEELQPESAEEARVVFPGVEVVCAPLDDVDPITPAIIRVANEAADYVARKVRLGRRVLVTCAQGKNRSGLISALTLVRLRGISGKEAALVVREARLPAAKALTNPAFSAYLESLPAPRRGATS